jgi:hypothetical protein
MADFPTPGCPFNQRIFGASKSAVQVSILSRISRRVPSIHPLTCGPHSTPRGFNFARMVSSSFETVKHSQLLVNCFSRTRRRLVENDIPIKCRISFRISVTSKPRYSTSADCSAQLNRIRVEEVTYLKLSHGVRQLTSVCVNLSWP